MKQEDIENAAVEFSIGKIEFRKIIKEVDSDNYTLSKCNCEEDFISGAKWRINSVWHAMDEVQDGKRPYIVQFNQGFRFAMFTKPIPVPKEQAKDVFKRWAYIEDLMPEEED